jgi:hypothetical protein
MTGILVLLAAVVAVGGVVSVTAREPRLATLGALVVMAASACVADPLPDLVSIAARLTGALLAGYLIWVSLRDGGAPTAGWQIGWPGSLAIAVAAFAIGWLAAAALGDNLAMVSGRGPSAAGVATALAGGSLVPRAGIGAAAALIALGAAPVVIARDVLRLGLGLLLMLSAADLVRHALGGEPDRVVELGMAVVMVISGAAVAGLVHGSLKHYGDLVIRPGTGRRFAIRHRSADEAHPRRTSEDAPLHAQGEATRRLGDVASPRTREDASVQIRPSASE